MSGRDFDTLAEKVRTWGRWGPDDQRGTLNHIGPEALRRAAHCVREGKLFNLGLRFDKDGPQLGKARFNPKLYVTDLFTPLNPGNPRGYYSDDVIHIPLQAATQWDALAHGHYDGKIYGGHAAHDVLTVRGAKRCGIEHMASPGIMSRGILLDIARLKGVDLLPLDYVITVADLREAIAVQGVRFAPGDILLVRTGHIRRFTIDRDRKAFNGMQPGLGFECAEWVFDNDIAAIAVDNLAVEAITRATLADGLILPLHMLALTDMGCPLGEIFDLEALAADCAEDGQYDFLFSAPPLAITGGFGSPINPLALK
jgi:kynurenine formamidase